VVARLEAQGEPARAVNVQALARFPGPGARKAEFLGFHPSGCVVCPGKICSLTFALISLPNGVGLLAPGTPPIPPPERNQDGLRRDAGQCRVRATSRWRSGVYSALGGGWCFFNPSRRKE
jgi:hypothetical protein